jgi:hypothetical protein
MACSSRLFIVCIRTDAAIPATRTIAMNMINEPIPIAAFLFSTIDAILIIIPSPPSNSHSVGELEKVYVLKIRINNKNKKLLL